eukprot:GHVR01088730.1.p2 GENE.GHVR01088730.1~~GHVR01088730.1.p2  ORF type:complete len:102 (+),score=0.67 GHVR01088730.1:4455-4760(+)
MSNNSQNMVLAFICYLNSSNTQQFFSAYYQLLLPFLSHYLRLHISYLYIVICSPMIEFNFQMSLASTTIANASASRYNAAVALDFIIILITTIFVIFWKQK